MVRVKVKGINKSLLEGDVEMDKGVWNVKIGDSTFLDIMLENAKRPRKLNCKMIDGENNKIKNKELLMIECKGNQ